MLLADPNDILNEYGFDSLVTVVSAITSAINAASPILSSRLGTLFDQVTLTDTFYVSEPGFSEGGSILDALANGIAGGYTAGVALTEFRLTQGFVQSIASINTAPAQSAFGTTGATDLSGTIIPSALQKEKGLLKDSQTRYSRSFVQVTYTAGFPADGITPTSYDLTKVPQWLQEAAKLRALIALSNSPDFKNAAITIDTKTVSQEYNALIAGKVRYFPVAVTAL